MFGWPQCTVRRPRRRRQLSKNDATYLLVVDKCQMDLPLSTRSDSVVVITSDRQARVPGSIPGSGKLNFFLISKEIKRLSLHAIAS